MADKNSKYSFNSPCHQSFSLPPDVISFILNNCASSKFFQKLQKTCKYFFNKKKVIVLGCYVLLTPKKLYYSSKKIDTTMDDNINNTMANEPLRKDFQYWFNNALIINTFRFSLRNEIISNYLEVNSLSIYRFDLKKLDIVGGTLTFKEICKFLNGGKVEELVLYYVNVHYEDGSPTTMDKILAKCPRILKLDYNHQNETFSTKTFENLNQLQFINKINKCKLIIRCSKNEMFNINIICEFFLKNVNPIAEETSILLLSDFSQPHSQTELQHYWSTVQEKLGNYFTKVPEISFGNI